VQYGRLVDTVVLALKQSIDAHKQLRERGVNDECFAGENSFGELGSASPGSVLSYLRHWLDYVSEEDPVDRVDVDAAVARRFADREEMAIKAQLTDEDLAMSGDVNPLHSLLLRKVLAVANSDWFNDLSEKEHSRKRKAISQGGKKAKKLKARLVAESLPELGVDYLRDFWRAPVGSERQCRNGTLCWCMHAPAKYPCTSDKRRNRPGFVCREMLLPRQNDVFLNSKRLPDVHYFCFFCELFVIATKQQTYVRKHEVPVGFLNRFTVKVGPGAFPPSSMLDTEIDGHFAGVAGSLLKLQVHDFEQGLMTVPGSREPVPCMRASSQLDFRPRSDK